jgi:hypothetical protein
MDFEPENPAFDKVQAADKRPRDDVFTGLPDAIRISSTVERYAADGRLSRIAGKEAWYWKMVRQYQAPRPPSASASVVPALPEPSFVCVTCATVLSNKSGASTIKRHFEENPGKHLSFVQLEALFHAPAAPELSKSVVDQKMQTLFAT